MGQRYWTKGYTNGIKLTIYTLISFSYILRNPKLRRCNCQSVGLFLLIWGLPYYVISKILFLIPLLGISSFFLSQIILSHLFLSFNSSKFQHQGAVLRHKLILKFSIIHDLPTLSSSVIFPQVREQAGGQLHRGAPCLFWLRGSRSQVGCLLCG